MSETQTVKIRRWAAEKLVRLAYRLDPNRPSVRHASTGGLILSMHGVDLAKITPGMVQQTRESAVSR